MPCERPTCFETKAGRCMNPNSWIIFLKNNKGKGLTRPQLKEMYDAWKGSNFPENSTVVSRREILCTQLIGPLNHVHEMNEREKRIAKEAEDLRRREDEIARMAHQDAQGRRDRETVKRTNREKGRKVILLEARRRKALVEKEKAERLAVRRAALHAKAIRALQKGIREKKRIVREKTKERACASRESVAMMKEDVRVAEKRLDTANNLREKRRKALNDSRFTDSPSTIAKKRSALVSKKKNATPSGLALMEQRTDRLNLVNRAENSLLHRCDIGNNHVSVFAKNFPEVSRRRGENFCQHLQRVYGMGNAVYPTTSFQERQRFLVYRGIRQPSATSVFIKVSLVMENAGRRSPLLEHHNGPLTRGALDVTPIQEFVYRTHVQKMVDDLFRGVEGVSVPKFYTSGLSLIGTGNTAQYAGLEVTQDVEGTTLLDYLFQIHPNKWDGIVWKLGRVLGIMHANLVAHGDFHLENLLYNIKTGKVTPIDLERAIVFSQYKRSKATVNKSLEYDVSQIMTSIGSAVMLRVQDNADEVSERMMDRFTRGYLNTKSTLQPKQMIWKHVKHGSIDIIQRQYTRNYYPVLSGAMEAHWQVANTQPVRLLQESS